MSEKSCKTERGRNSVDCTEPLQEGRVHNCGGEDLWPNCKEPQNTGDKKICGEYITEATIHNKMRLGKCNEYKAKETLGNRGRKTYVEAAKREGQEKNQIHKNSQSSTMRRREGIMEEQNRVNEKRTDKKQKG